MKKIEIDKELKKILNTQTLLKFPDGCKFTGMTKKKGNMLIPHGLGFGLWPNGHSYKGQYKNGQFDGWGNYITRKLRILWIMEKKLYEWLWRDKIFK